jgi:hypothetical protein
MISIIYKIKRFIKKNKEEDPLFIAVSVCAAVVFAAFGYMISQLIRFINLIS